MNDLIRNLVNPLITFFRTLAEQTDTQIDDSVVDVLEKVVQNEVLFNWLIRRITSGTGVVAGSLTDTGPYALSPQVTAAFTAEGVSDEDYEAFVNDLLPSVCETVAAVPLR